MAIEGKFFRPPAGHSFLFGLRGTGKSTWLLSALPNGLTRAFDSPAPNWHEADHAADNRSGNE